MPEKDRRKLPCGLLVDRHAKAWIHKSEPDDCLAVSIRLDSHDCEIPTEYKIRAHGVTDPKLRARFNTAGDSGLIGTMETKRVYVQFPKSCYPGIRLSIQVYGAIHPISVEFDESQRTPEKPYYESNTPLRGGHPTPMKTLLSKSGLATRRWLNSPFGNSKNTIGEPASPLTMSRLVFSTSAATDHLPGVDDYEIEALESYLSALPEVSRDDIWCLVYYSLMEVFVGLGWHSRDWFRRNGHQNLCAKEERAAPYFPELTLEYLVIQSMIETLEVGHGGAHGDYIPRLGVLEEEHEDDVTEQFKPILAL
ncbi:unnamed protein product, partial [Mesorhabditis spiculigera]